MKEQLVLEDSRLPSAHAAPPDAPPAVPAAEKRDELETAVTTGHSIDRPLDEVLEAFTYDQQLYEQPRAPRRRRERQGRVDLPGFVPESGLQAGKQPAARSPWPHGLRLRPFLALGALLLVFVLAAQGLRSLFRHQAPASAVDLIIGQQRQVKLPLIRRDMARDRLEVAPHATRRGAQRPAAHPTLNPATALPSARARAASPNPTFRPYHLRRGDTLRSIAVGTHLSEHTIAQVNRLSPRLHRLKPGGLVYFPRSNGVLHPVQPHESLVDLSIRYRVGLARLQAANPQLHGLRLRPGQRVFVPGARRVKFRPRPAVRRARVVARSSASRHHGALAFVVSDRMAWPAVGEHSSGFGPRWGGFHSGIDIANNYGTPIHAALDGVVISVSYEGGYGNTIDIRHGNGLVTRYAHCARFYVTAGQRVSQGQVIAGMGSTGNATGPHVHFEVRLNDSAVNPLSYL